ADGVLLWADNHGGMRLAPGARGVGIVTHADEIEELDINPLIVCTQGKGAWIADALLVLGNNDEANNNG
ncbi:acetate--CoA ligase family protein, partial [Mesorhizobium sp. M0622]|uniref:hypothetical protein n=1 Tax=Mesorhizobium sp. M0622 TaxID=2956975 RepID=UPI0033394A73